MDKQQNWANQLRQAGWTGMADRVERGQSPSSALFSEVSSSYSTEQKEENKPENKPKLLHRLNTKILAIIFVIIIVGYLAFLIFSVPTIQFGNGQVYKINYYADTLPQLERGLMFTDVNNNTIFLMQYPSLQKRIYITMNGTYSNLDIIWINASSGIDGINGNIVNMVSNATGCLDNCSVYSSNAPANYVVETSAGFIKQNNLYINESVQISG
jgi:uncharacterized membrane protein (UPF0127 family)